MPTFVSKRGKDPFTMPKIYLLLILLVLRISFFVIVLLLLFPSRANFILGNTLIVKVILTAK
jgi:hypothetical protein